MTQKDDLEPHQEETNLAKRSKRDEEPPQQYQSLAKSVSLPEPQTKRIKRADHEEDFQSRISLLDAQLLLDSGVS
jgi:dipeptidase